MPSRFIELSRGRLHFMAEGAGPGVVLLHGWPGFWFDYRRVLPAVAPCALAVAPDFFGFGDSEPVTDDPARAADEESLASDVLELLDGLSLDRAVLVGHDIGSAVAPAVARLAPERVRGLILLNPTHPYIGDKRYMPAAQREAWYQHFHLLPLAGQLIDGDRRRVEQYLAHFYAHWAGDTCIDSDELSVVADTYARPGAFTSSIAWYRARAARRDRGDIPPPIEVPTIALWGDRDPMRPLAHREGFTQAFPRSTSTVLPGVGHFVPAEAPGAVAAAITELLQATSDQ
jgi:pimeloyl-ACP methyl ester carboxylesterase